MPKSRVRKKKVYTPPKDVAPTSSSSYDKPSPRWLPVVALIFAVFGMVWLVTFYMTEGLYPIGVIQYWNIAIGFGAIIVSLLIFTRWR